MLHCFETFHICCIVLQDAVLYRTVDSGSAVDLLIYRCLSTSGLGQVTSVLLVLGTNHFGHRHFPSLGVIPCELRDDLYLSRNYNDFAT